MAEKKHIEVEKIREFISYWERVIYPFDEDNESKMSVKTVLKKLENILLIHQY